MANNNRKKIPGNIIKWILAVFMFSGCLVYWFSFASIIFALLGVYFLPIAPIQNFFNKAMPKKKVLRGIIAFVIFVVGCCVAPQVETTAPEVTNPTDITISSEATSEPTVDVTTEITTDEMFGYIRASMARHKVPKYIEFVDAFPMNAAGKILKYKMREQAAKDLGLVGDGADTAGPGK